MTVLRKWVVTSLVLLITAAGYSQVLFSYGKNTVSKEEFLKAYNKNNLEDQPTDKAYREYLDLYIKFKIKVQAALDMKMDTLPNQVAELRAFRNQIVENYIRDEASVNVLVDEAIERSKKDIRLSHIFVAIKDNATEEAIQQAKDRINEAWNRLKKGEDFGAVAAQYSDDPSVAANKGDIGYITVFVLPYELENLAYSTAPGKFSAPARTKAGFHIFKNTGERPAMGKLKTAQILLAFNPGASDAEKNEVKRKADSLYTALTQGADFKAMAASFSDDNLTYQNGGEMMEFGVGRYAPAFEAAAFALANDGDISKPVLTEYGYHIIKRLKQIPIETGKDNTAFRDGLKQQVQASDRMEVSRKVLLKKILEQVKFKKSKFDEKQLAILTDSALQNKPTPTLEKIKPNTVLFTFAKQTYRVSDWQKYLESINAYRHLHEGKSTNELLDQYIDAAAMDYYRDHLEEFNKEFTYQLNEFREGNLLFEIMQRKIWDPASTDSAGLRKYYDAHKNNYWWEASADAIIFTANTEAAVEDIKKKLQDNYKDWKSYIDNSDGLVQGDSGRFELGQIPVLERTNFQNGLITAPVKNENDNSLTFAYIVKVYRDREPRSFEDARGFVINDYQVYLEEKWVEELKKKYPVRINEAIVKGLPK